MSSAEIVRYGDWWDRPDIRPLKEAVAWLERRNFQEAARV